jgi:hypothetical protein
LPYPPQWATWKKDISVTSVSKVVVKHDEGGVKVVVMAPRFDQAFDMVALLTNSNSHDRIVYVATRGVEIKIKM